MYIRLHVKYPFFLSYLIKLEFSGQIFEKYATNFMRDRPAGDELFYAERRTDKRRAMTRLIFPFCNSVNALKYISSTNMYIWPDRSRSISLLLLRIRRFCLTRSHILHAIVADCKNFKTTASMRPIMTKLFCHVLRKSSNWLNI